jgi:Host cell surface-exposed lipoprotein
MKRIGIFLVLLLVGGLIFAGQTMERPATPSRTLAGVSASNSASVPGVVKQPSHSQRKAIALAKEYISYRPFSRKSLIYQMKFEGFTAIDAIYAVDHLPVNWNTQAYKKAKRWLDYRSFSQSELVGQLMFDGFTPDQAEFAVDKAYQ